MNIFARVIGVGVFAYFLMMFCLLIAFSDISVKGLLRGYLVVLAVMGFFYEPYVTADLYRIREMMESFSAMGFSAFVRTFVTNSTVPVARVLYWAVGKTGVLGLLPAISALVSYGCSFYILEDSAQRFQSSRADVATALLFLMSVGSYMAAVSNIRTMMAVSLICLCVYRETVQRKRNVLHLLLYAAAAGLHTMGLAVIALRVMLPVFKRGMALWKKGLLILAAAAAAAALPVVMPGLAAELAEKVSAYIFGDEYSYFWEYLIGAVALAVESYALWICFRQSLPRDETYESVCWLLVLCILTAVLFCFEFSIFHRMITYIAPILTVPLLLMILSDSEGAGGANRRTMLQAVSLCLLALSCSRGSLCSFKFF